MRLAALLLCCLLTCAVVSCDRAEPPEPPARPELSFLPIEQPARVLLIAETEGPQGAAVAESAAVIEMLVAHFGEYCETVTAGHYEPGTGLAYHSLFYLAGKPDEKARASFLADLERHKGIAAWVGPGAASLGGETLARLGLGEADDDETLPEALDWTIAYRTQSHVERLAIPAVYVRRPAVVLAVGKRGSETRPFIAGGDRLWYVAAGPSLTRERFWTACIWADALHEILERSHSALPRRLVPVLRDVPVWARPDQVPHAVAPMLASAIPVTVMAWTNWRDVPLADRPEAVRGLRAAESLGATVALVADTGLDPLEHFRLAWEVGLHPIAWAGPTTTDNPFRLRIAGPNETPPYWAGGMLPAPIDISDAGHIAAEDTARLAMLSVVRDAVALVSFGLWALPEEFESFLRRREAEGWLLADLRDFDALVEDKRRTLVSGLAELRIPPGARVRQVTLDPHWEMESEERWEAAASDPQPLRVNPPERRVVIVELVPEKSPRSFIKGVTLDPWAYSGTGLSTKELAGMLAERYQRNGVNTVFFYAYNVGEGAAYRTRYRGASLSEWGHQDLLAHVLEACHARGIRVVAWAYSGRDKKMWKNHPEWRERERDGRAHNPLRLHAAYFLCPRNAEVREWYSGLVKDLARRYPTLDGIELCEPVVNWFGDQACYCQTCREEFAREHAGEPLGGEVWRAFRAEGLTEFLSDCIKAVAQEGIDTYIMTISDAWSNGAILSPRRQAAESGFDLEALLEGPYPPDWVNFEIIWQQWAAIYGTKVFNYDWAEETAQRLVRRTDGRARVLLHVELTDFGSQRMTPEKIATTIDRLRPVEVEGIECYHSGAVDRKTAWPLLKNAYEGLP